jgi:hypothetical protein
MNTWPDDRLIEEVALLMGITEAYVEKDWYVTQVISLLATDQYEDFELIFTGGTCLSKAHKLIQRFSEDIDFRVVAPNLQDLAGSALKKRLSNYKQHLVERLAQPFTILTVAGRDSNRHIMIDLAYPTRYLPALALRPHIKLEFTLSSLSLPSLVLPVSSFVQEAARLPPEVAGVVCMNPVENAVDKLSALVWRIPSRVRGEGDRQPDVVRHLHDLAQLSQHALAHPQFEALAVEAIERDAHRSAALKGMSIVEKIEAMGRIMATDGAYAIEYSTFVQGMSYATDTPIPAFEEALQQVNRLTERLMRYLEAL